jgi:hypothetical protein
MLLPTLGDDTVGSEPPKAARTADPPIRRGRADESIVRSAPLGPFAPLPRGGIQVRTLRTHGRPSMK